jgi:hypothetical protein
MLQHGDYTDIFSLLDGSECYVGNTLSSNATSPTGCTMGCSGKTTELCGGSDVANLYENTAYVTPTPTQVRSTSGFKLIGCYTDSASSRTLQGDFFQDQQEMAVDKCVQQAELYRYAGVESLG